MFTVTPVILPEPQIKDSLLLWVTLRLQICSRPQDLIARIVARKVDYNPSDGVKYDLNLKLMESMKVLVEPANPNLDIVFVHGLNPKGSEDHARSTWTYSANGNNVFWPDALLRESIPSARIILFAYNSSVGTNASNTPVHSHAETLLNRLNLIRQQDSEKHRRLIFVAHSMGGLLVKQALVEAGIHSSNYGCIRVSTGGLVFFATPHAGGNLAGLADVAANFTSAMTGSAKNSLLKTLKQNSLLNEISKDHFRPQSGDYEVLTFIESKKMDVRIGDKRMNLRLVPQITSLYIVEADSAKLGVAGELQLHLNRNHSDICKFFGPGDPDYDLVSGNLLLMARKIRNKDVRCTECDYSSETLIEPIGIRHPPIPYASSIPGAPPSFIGLTGRAHPLINSLPLCKPFIGREDLMKEILETWANWESQEPRRISLSGLGGVGKTQMSRSIIGQLGQPQLTIWLNAGSSDSLEEDLKGAAISLKHELLRTAHDREFYYTAGARIDYLVELLKVWLSMAQARERDMPQVLVVIDDVDGLESSKLSEISKMVAGDGIDIIFNTRDPTIADRTSYMDATNFDVPPLQQDQARDLLYDLTKIKVKPNAVRTPALAAAKSFAEMEFLSDIATSFGFLPAALVSGSHYLTDHLASRSPYAIKSYVARWNSDADRRQILQFRRTTSRYPHTMQSSFQVSFQRLWRNTNAENHPALYFCCLNLLRMLSALKITCFARVELESLCDLLRSFIQVQEPYTTGQDDGELTGLRFSLRQLSEDASKAPRCVTELVRVSLLTTPEGTDTLDLNQLIVACVMLRVQPGSADLGLDGAESLLLQRAAGYISENWVPCLPLAETVGQTEL